MKVGTVLGDRFHLTGPLGAGGMGRLFRAIDLECDVEVAVKVLPPRFFHSETWYAENGQKLAAEGDIGRQLHDVDGTPVVHLIGAHGELSYVVMEIIEGVSLTELIDRNRSIKRRAAVAIACQLGEILDAVHHRGFVHRDVKNDNVKVDPRGRVYLLDFGIAKHIDAENKFGGTHGYAPYEQVRHKKLTFQSDIYALGCLVCQMVANRLPFLEEDDWNVGEVPVEVPARVLHRLGPDLAAVVLRMIDRDLTRRFATMAEAVRHLSRLLPPPGSPPDPQALDPDPEAWLRANPLRIPLTGG
ncbi:serine/threonine-protein kinase [Lentzea sp. NEAU-D7]|uniref:serine/threonine-protein kinase n=1 Tax=Lentzea sp. NEAU-D7 TaxID=2994667 RepID=UPI00224AD2F6|nr:serine/threonine-protein kinase [Lentzea sp. NEAU-D7]MCX2952833.1 serine/threonine-protein kinase [Lentzea sp. NEAU-D7]